MRIVFALLFATLFTTVATPLLADPELKGSPEELRQFLQPTENTVTLFAEAEETVYSDTAIVDLIVRTESKKLSEAMAANNLLRETLTKSMVASGLKADAINNAKFATSPQYGWFGDKPSSYEVLNRITIKVLDETHLQRIAALADQHKEVEMGGTRFEHSQKDAFENKVKKAAIAKLMRQKQDYESELGLTLQPISFRKANIDILPTPGADILEEVVVTASRSQKSDSYLSKRGAQEPAAAPSFDEVRYQAGIYVDFRIVTKN